MSVFNGQRKYCLHATGMYFMRKDASRGVYEDW